MDVTQILGGAKDAMTSKRVFGEAYEQDGVVVIPVARVSGGGGGGQGGSDEQGEGGGLGFGLRAEPAGVYVIQDGSVRWEPAVDVNRIVIGVQVLLLTLAFVLRTAIKRSGRKRR